MRKASILRYCAIAVSLTFVVPAIVAQNSIRLFDPVNVRASATGTGIGSQAVTFNSATLNLTCATSPITATLTSSADGTGNVLVDNYVQVSVTSGTAVSGPVNVCRGGTADSTPSGPSQNCFTSSYQGPASSGSLTGQNPDNFVSTGGVPSIDISSQLQQGSVQVKIDLVDTGTFLTSSTLYLRTNCSQNGVTGPATITGNPISSTPTPQQLTQSFPFNPTTNQQVQFVYDLSIARAAGTLSITPATIPTTNDLPFDPTEFQSKLVANTSFATSSCLIHSGELINGLPACKMFTLTCAVGTGSTGSGAQCPVASLPNEVFQDVFDGPSFTLPDIATPNGPTFHQGVGFLMASEGWLGNGGQIGGPCTFDPASGLQNLPCPQNLLSNFSGPGLYNATGSTSHPNSTFVPVAQVPEDLTTVTVAGQHPGGWINTSAASVTLSSQPPVLAGSNLPGSTSFIASPILSITYGISASNNVPSPGAPASTDTVVQNSIPCPAPANPVDPPATVFTTDSQDLSGLADGNYLLHYFARDCAGTEELKFSQDGGGSWSTSYYTSPINVDTVAPVVASGPVLSPATGGSGSYAVGQAVTAAYSCTDERSGVVRCGDSTFSPSSTVLNTGTINSPVDTSTPGPKTYTVTVIDAAGNQSSASANYVVTAYDTAIKITLAQSTVTYPLGTNVVISVAPSRGHVPTGTVQLYDGPTLLQTSQLQGNGAAYLYIQGLAAGSHSLSVVYRGDAFNPGGNSAPVTLKVNPVPVNLTASCWNANFPYGADYHCGVYASSTAGAPQGVVTYQYDGGASITLPLQNGTAQFIVPQPPAGSHRVLIAYAAQTNYAAAKSVNENFTVTPAPVIVQLTPSTWYLTGGNLGLSAAIQSWSAGPPNQVGSVVFYDGSKIVATVGVNASGIAATTVAASSLSNGSHTFRANYSGGTNYAAGNASVTVNVAR
jgi:Bacterial Ig-like domain (group 3)